MEDDRPIRPMKQLHDMFAKKPVKLEPIGNTLEVSKYSVLDRCIGSLLTVMIGDALGASVEGFAADEIEEEFPGGVVKYEAMPHMGLWHLGPRRAMYTDDTNAALGLASSIVECRGLNPKHCALSYAHFWSHKPERGCPPSASRIMKALLDGTPYTETGTMQFKDGSWANGAPMRIAPIGIAFRNASDEELYEATRQALIATHVHPNAVDAAFIVCKAISLVMKHPEETPIADFNLDAFLHTLLSVARTVDMKERLQTCIDHHKDEFESVEKEHFFVKCEIADDFQIIAVDAVGLVIWAFVRHFNLSPHEMITKMIGYGGDTDTTACILGSIVGALHGTHWIPYDWYHDLENDDWGRDYCVGLARNMADLDLRTILPAE